jgi:hypothetical protein
MGCKAILLASARSSSFLMLFAKLPIEIGGLVGIVSALQELVPCLPRRLFLGPIPHLPREFHEPIFERERVFKPPASQSHRTLHLLMERFCSDWKRRAGT